MNTDPHPLASSAPRVAVLGGGITGLTAAWELQRHGLAPVVFEKAPRVGGAIQTLRRGEWLHELGPNSLLDNSAEVAALLEQIGLAGRRLYAAPAAKSRYIVRRGRLVPMPASPLGFIATRLFSGRAKLSLCAEPWRARGAADVDESVADFVRRRLGREFLDYAINPFVAGVHAGDPERLSVRHAFPKLHALEQTHGSLIRGALKQRNASGGPKGRIYSFPNGLAELPEMLAQRLGDAIRVGCEITAVRQRGTGWQIEWQERGLASREEFDAVVCALPAAAIAALNLEGVDDARRLQSLRQIKHPPVVSVFMGFKRETVGHALDGFGFLVPQVEHRRVLGTLFSSTLFPGRAPPGCVALTTFVGGTRQPELAGLAEPELLTVVQYELAKLVGITAPPVFTHVRAWRQAIPQYELGHERYLDAITSVQESARGLFIGGNCCDGISLPHCIASGRRLANAVLNERSRWSFAAADATA